MSEISMRSTVVQLLKPVHGVAVENPACPGSPDVNFVEGWVELKYLTAWPKRKGTPARVEHFTPIQRLWIKERAMAGGRVFIILQVRFEWLVLPPIEGSKLLGFATRDELLDICVLHCPFRLDREKLFQFLCPSYLHTKN